MKAQFMKMHIGQTITQFNITELGIKAYVKANTPSNNKLLNSCMCQKVVSD